MEGHIFGKTVLEIFTKEFFVKIFKPIFRLSDKFGLLVPLEAVQAYWKCEDKVFKSVTWTNLVDLAQLGLTRLSLTQLDSAWLNSTQLNLAQLDFLWNYCGRSFFSKTKSYCRLYQKFFGKGKISIKGFALFKYCESVPSLAGMSSQLQPYSTLTFSIVRSS